MKTGGFKAVLRFVTGGLLAVLGVSCVCCQFVGRSYVFEDVSLAAVALTMPGVNSENTALVQSGTDTEAAVTVNSPKIREVEGEEEALPEYDASIHDNEAHYPVVETKYTEGNTACNGFFVKDTMGLGIDFDEESEKPLGFEVTKGSEVQVLIVHTHTTESYMEYDLGYYHESFYPRTDDERKNMVAVGERIAKSLEAQGIGVVHAKEVHDSPEYTGAYSRSYDTIMKYMEKYPDIKVVLDIHRDSIASMSDNGKYKPTFEANGKKAAQIMIMSGCDTDGSYGFPDWQYNLRFALKLQKIAEQMYPGMTRPLYFGDFAYNMPVCTGSLLVEVGTDVNTVEEAKYTGELLGNVLSRVLQSEM